MESHLRSMDLSGSTVHPGRSTSLSAGTHAKACAAIEHVRGHNSERCGES